MYNWVKGMIRSIASVLVTFTGFILVGRDISGAQAGLVISFAVVASQGTDREVGRLSFILV